MKEHTGSSLRTPSLHGFFQPDFKGLGHNVLFFAMGNADVHFWQEHRGKGEELSSAYTEQEAQPSARWDWSSRGLGGVLFKLSRTQGTPGNPVKMQLLVQ